MPEHESTFTVGPSLRERTAVVTGASRGIGLAIAGQLVRDGARVVITARKQDALDEAVERLGGPEHALAVAGRTDDAEHRAATVRAAVETFGSLDLLVNNTGINPAYGPLHGASTSTPPARSPRSTASPPSAGSRRPTPRGSASTAARS